MKKIILGVISVLALSGLVGCGGGGGSGGGNTGGGGGGNAGGTPSATYNVPLTGVGAAGNYTMTTTRTSSGLTQNGVTRPNVILPATQALFCSDAAVHAAVTATIGFMGTLNVTSCTFSGVTGQVGMMIDLGIGQGFTTPGTVNFSYAPTPAASNPGITQVLPASASVGTTVTIMGTNFTQAASSYSVSFNGVLATPILRTLTQLAVTVPVGATSGALTVTDLVTGQVFTVPGSFVVPVVTPPVVTPPVVTPPVVTPPVVTPPVSGVPATPVGVTGTATQYFSKKAMGNTWTWQVTNSTSAVTRTSTTTVKNNVLPPFTAAPPGVSMYFTCAYSNGITCGPTWASELIDATGAWVSNPTWGSFGTSSVVLPSTFSVGTSFATGSGTATIAAFNVLRTVPAGTFPDCLQVNTIVPNGLSSVAYTSYYSIIAGRMVEQTWTYSTSGVVTAIETVQLQAGYIANP